MATPDDTVLVFIKDAVLRLDVESALSGAGYRIVHPQGAEPPEDAIVAAALIDADPAGDDTLLLVSRLQRRGVRCLILTSPEEDARLLPDGVVRLSKPFYSDHLVARLRGGSGGCLH